MNGLDTSGRIDALTLSTFGLSWPFQQGQVQPLNWVKTTYIVEVRVKAHNATRKVLNFTFIETLTCTGVPERAQRLPPRKRHTA